MLRQKQLLIFGGMAAAVATCLWVALFMTWGAPDPAPAEAGERLAFAVRWLLVPGLCLFAGIGLVANQRFLKPDAIDGERRVESKSFEINQRYNQNTLEQLALAAVAWTGLALALPVDQLGVIARLAVLFGVGRAAFWLGYLYAPWARAFGMGLTAYPQFVALVWLAINALR
jgi:MAPEG family